MRFGLLIGAVALLVFLILFQEVLRDGLITSFVGAIEHQDAPVLVVSTDARCNLQSSTITPELQREVAARDAQGGEGRIRTARFPSNPGPWHCGSRLAARLGPQRR